MTEAIRLSTRDALVAGALAVLAESGPEASVATITDRAGVAVGSFYNHFDSKDALFAEAARSAFEQFEGAMAARTAHIANPVERLCTRTRLFCRLSDSDPQLASVVVNASARSLIAPTGYSPAFASDAQQAADAGEIDGTDLPMKLLVIAAAAERIVTQAIVFDLVPDERADDVTALALELLGMPRADARRMAHRPLIELVQ